MNKRFYYTALLTFFFCNLFAQVKIITRTDSLFFVGIDNEVLITSSKLPFEKLSIIVDGGSISGKKGKYIFRCSAPGTNASIKVFYFHKLIAEKKMQVVRISEPEVYIAGDTLITGGLISRKNLLTFDSLIVKTNMPFLAMTVIHFEFKKISNGQITDSIKNHSNKFSASIKKLLAKAVKGDVYIFDEALSTGPDDNGTIYQSIKLTVTD